MQPATYQFPVNDVGDPEPVTIQSSGHNIREVTIGVLRSDAGWGSTGFYWYAPDTTSDPEFISIGGTKNIVVKPGQQPFRTGQTIGYVATESGSVTFFQSEA